MSFFFSFMSDSNNDFHFSFRIHFTFYCINKFRGGVDFLIDISWTQQDYFDLKMKSHNQRKGKKKELILIK